jgi:hypothetical protein
MFFAKTRDKTPMRRSFRLNARELDHLGPLFGFLRNEFPEIGWRTRKRFAPKVGVPRQ